MSLEKTVPIGDNILNKIKSNGSQDSVPGTNRQYKKVAILFGNFSTILTQKQFTNLHFALE
jgi:hypothetical protein